MKFALYFTEINLFDGENCGVLPSLQAAGCLLLASITHKPLRKAQKGYKDLLQSLSHISGHTSEIIEKVADLSQINSEIFEEKFPSCQFFTKQNKDIIHMRARNGEISEQSRTFDC